MNAILRSTAAAALLALSLVSAGCSLNAPRPVPVDDTQAYVDGTISPTIASIDQSLRTLVILSRGDEGPRKAGAIGDTVAGAGARRAPMTVSPSPAKEVPRQEVPRKEMARLEHGVSPAPCHGNDPLPPSCSAPPLAARTSRPSGSLATDPRHPPASPPSYEDGGAAASVAASARAATQSLATRVRIHWDGTPESLVSQVARAIGFAVQTEGALGGLKVSIHEEDASVESVLRHAAAQIDGRADIRVDTAGRVIWLVATRRP